MGMQRDAVFGDGDKREVEAAKKNNKAIQGTGGVYFCSHAKFDYSVKYQQLKSFKANISCVFK